MLSSDRKTAAFKQDDETSSQDTRPGGVAETACSSPCRLIWIISRLHRDCARALVQICGTLMRFATITICQFLRRLAAQHKAVTLLLRGAHQNLMGCPDGWMPLMLPSYFPRPLLIFRSYSLNVCIISSFQRDEPCHYVMTRAYSKQTSTSTSDDYIKLLLLMLLLMMMSNMASTASFIVAVSTGL